MGGLRRSLGALGLVALLLADALAMTPVAMATAPGRGHLGTARLVASHVPTPSTAVAAATGHGPRHLDRMLPGPLAATAPAGSTPSPRTAAPGPLVPSFTLTVDLTGTGTGSVTSSPAGIDCPATTCSASYPSGTQVTLTASGDSGSAFVGWDGACSGMIACSPVLSADATVSAGFLTSAQVTGTAPQLASSGGWSGVDAATAGLEPPDPWVAVNASYVVQATNDGLRVTDRSGVLKADYFLWDFFGEPAGTVFDGDPHVVWDASAGRWLASELSSDCSAGHLYVAISAGADPTGAWSVFVDDFAGQFPDYPALGYSDDKVALSYNLYDLTACAPGGFLGGGFLVFDLATLKAGGSTIPNWDSGYDPGHFTFRPQAGLSAGATLHLAVELVGASLTSGEVGTETVTGTVAGALTATGPSVVAVPPFTVAPEPVQPGSPGTIAVAYDERPTDAAWWNNALWIVSTTGCQPSGDTATEACVRVQQLGGANQDFVIGAAGLSTFMGGIGFSGNGTLFVVYTQSGPSTYASTYVAYQASGGAAGSIHVPALVRAGEATYKGQRWGDFVGVAQDPSDATAVWQADEYASADGGWATWVSRLSTGKTGAPAGTIAINGGAATTKLADVTLSLTPAAGSGVTQVLVSDSPTTKSGLLAQARELAPGAAIPWSLTDTTVGGTNATGTHSVYVQWGDGAGDWSTVSSTSITFSPDLATRLAGSSRFGTAAAISAATFSPGVPVAYIAYWYNFPDALAGAAAAGLLPGPVLLAKTNLPLDTSTTAELTRVKPRLIIVLGGTGVISDAVLNALKPYATSGVAIRLAGASRFDTAAAVSKAIFYPGVDVAYIAYAYNFPDALAGAAAAGTIQGPVLLANTNLPINTATTTELTRLKPKKIIVLGGTGVISDAVLNGLKPYATSGTVTRLAGPSRYDTAAAISKATFSPGVPVAYIAYAQNFPDALAGAAAAGTIQGPVLLANTNLPLNAATTTELTRLKPHRVIVLGGTGVISDAVLNALKAYATGP